MRHVMTRYLAKVVTCCVALVGQHGATRSSRPARLARYVFRGSPQSGQGWTCPPHFFQKLVLRSMQIQSTKD